MQYFIRPIILLAATSVCGAAYANHDSCQELKDQYAQSCVNPQATSSKWGAVLMGTSCVIAARAIQKCESRENDPANDDDDDNNNNDNNQR
jgi:hypothetical protein